MPTYQTASLRPPVFPTLVRNSHGFQPLKGNTIAHPDLPAPGEAFHPSWKKEADFAALSRVENNRIKDDQMLKGFPSIKGNMPFTTYRGPQGHALSGGTVWTTQAEKTIQALLRDRKSQLDAIDQASFDVISPERVKEALPESDTFALDKLFSDLYSAVSSGVITSSLITIMGTIISTILTKGDAIPERKFAEYASLLTQMTEEMDTLYASSSMDFTPQEFSKMGMILRKLDNDTKLLLQYIKDFSAYLGSPTKTKILKLAAIRNKLLESRGRYVPVPGEVPEEEGEDVRGDLPPGFEQYAEAARNPPMGSGRRRY